MEELKGRTVLVTGASRGIGRAVAQAFTEAGAWVGMVARGEPALRRAADELRGHAIAADVSLPADVHRVTDYLVELLGEVPDVLVNAAGAFSLAPLAEADPADFERMYAANLRGPFLMMRAFLPLMLARGAGHLVSIGSVAGRVALPGNGAYAASKFGLRALHEVLAEELRGTGVCATLVEPAATDTPLWDPLDPDANPALPPRRAMLRPDEVARVVLFAVSQPAGVEIPLLAVRASR